jgi:hypothetical protein
MKYINMKLNKKILLKIRDEINLKLFNSKNFEVKDMKTVNAIVRGLGDVKLQIYYN